MSHRCGGARPVSDSLTPVGGISAEGVLRSGSHRQGRHTYLLVDTSLLLLNLFFQPSQASSVRCSAIGLEYLNVPSNPCQYLSFKDNPRPRREGISIVVHTHR